MTLRSGFRRCAPIVFGVLGGAVVLSGCSGNGTTSALPQVHVTPLTSVGQIGLPLDAFQPAFAQQVLAGQAVTKLADDCLAQRGLSAGSAFLGHVDNPMSAIDMSAVQWLSVATAEKYGFNAPVTAGVRQYAETDWAAGGVLGLAPMVSQALYQGGCLTQATAPVIKGIGSTLILGSSPAKLTGYLKYYALTWPGLPIQLEERAVKEAEADPRAPVVTSAWSACMQQQGYKYASPAAALADPRWAPGTAETKVVQANHSLQLRVAVADAGCQQKVDFAGTRLALLKAYQNRLVTAYSRQLHEYDAQYATLTANSRLIQEGSS